MPLVITTPRHIRVRFKPTTHRCRPGSWRPRWRRCWACRTFGATRARRRAASALCSGPAMRSSRGARAEPPRPAHLQPAGLPPPSCEKWPHVMSTQQHRTVMHLPCTCPVCVYPVAAGSVVWEERGGSQQGFPARAQRLTAAAAPAVARAEFEAALQRRGFAFSVLVHSDPASALVDFLPSSSVLQVLPCLRVHDPRLCLGS